MTDNFLEKAFVIRSEERSFSLPECFVIIMIICVNVVCVSYVKLVLKCDKMTGFRLNCRLRHYFTKGFRVEMV